MVVVRAMILLALLASVLSFILYALTSQVKHRQRGLAILKWTLVAAFGFFAILIIDRVA